MIASVLSLLLSTVKLWITVLILAIISVALYATFYYWYIPHFISTFPLFFQYDAACTQLATLSDLQSKLLQENVNQQVQKRGSGLTSLADCQFIHYDIHHQHYYFLEGQLYNFEVRLDMPDSSVNNHALGMFMVRLRLYNRADKELFTIARPALYPYQSTYLRLIRLFMGSVFYLTNFYSESNTLKVALIDEHVPQIDAVPFGQIDRIRVEIETYKAIEIHPPSHLYITARLEGIQYWMYFWPITSLIFFTCTIFSILVFICLIFYIRQLLNSPQPNSSMATDGTNEAFVSSSSSSALQGELLPRHLSLPLPAPKIVESFSGELQNDFDSEFEDNWGWLLIGTAPLKTCSSNPLPSIVQIEYSDIFCLVTIATTTTLFLAHKHHLVLLSPSTPTAFSHSQVWL